jgi:cardiolipin synthase
MMHLLIQPDDGVAPVLAAIASAKISVDVAVFRLDIKAIVNALGAAVSRGVAVRALVAHTNKGDEQGLRKLEVQLLGVGVTVSRTADDLVRYHGKMMVIDGKTLHVQGFNFTTKDIGNSRSFGIVTTMPALVKEAIALFRADVDRQPYVEGCAQFLVSPINARSRLMTFIAGAKRQLCIYDQHVTDPTMLRLLADRQRAGVDVRIIGRVGAKSKVTAQKYPGKRLHVRAIIRDESQAFLGSQSLRTLELDRRREVGVVVRDRTAVKRMLETFEADWALTDAARSAAGAVLGEDQLRPGSADVTAIAADATEQAVEAAAVALDAVREVAADNGTDVTEAARLAAAEAKAAAKQAKAAAKAAALHAKQVEGRAGRVAREAAEQAKKAALDAKAAARSAKDAVREATAALKD